MMVTKPLVKSVLIGLCLMVGTAAFAQPTIRYVDMARVFEGYHKTVRSEAELKRQEEIYQEHAQELVQEVERLRDQRDALQEQALNVALSDEARQMRRNQAREVEQLHNEKQRELRHFMNEKQQELRGRYIELRNALSDELLEAVRAYAGTNNIDVVLDVSGMSNNMLPVILHYPEGQEITDAILEQVNQGHED